MYKPSSMPPSINKLARQFHRIGWWFVENDLQEETQLKIEVKEKHAYKFKKYLEMKAHCLEVIEKGFDSHFAIKGKIKDIAYLIDSVPGVTVYGYDG